MSKGEALPFLNGVSRFLGYHNRRRIGVATDHVRHDGYVDHTEIRYTVHIKRWVDDGEWMELGSLDAILMRKDPPFDAQFLYSTFILEAAERTGALAR